MASHDSVILDVDDGLVRDTDIVVHSKYLTRVRRGTNSGECPGLNSELDDLIHAADGVVRGVQSRVGSGKTRMLSECTEEVDSVSNHGVASVGLITYRQALALNMLTERMRDLGFVHYLEGARDLGSRIIIQLDSILKLFGRTSGGMRVPKFDLLILDESECLLNHCTAQTLGARQGAVFRAFCAIIRGAKRVLMLDAFLAAETREFVASLGLSMRVVRNTFRTEEPRNYVFGNTEVKWVVRIIKALMAGENVAVASMSAMAIRRLKETILEQEVLTEEQILLIDSRTDEAIKRRAAQFCNTDFKKRLTMWSPAIECGVNFDEHWFHRMFVYMCSGSTSPSGINQSQARVRELVGGAKARTVHCLCQRVTTCDTVSPYTPEDALEHFQWQEGLVWPKSLDFTCQLPVEEHVTDSGDMVIGVKRDDPLTTVATHNYARLINAQRRFLPDFIRFLEYGGHKWEIGPDWQHRRGKQEKILSEAVSHASFLLGATPISDQQAKSYLLQQVCGTATQEMKDSLDRYFYARSWGIRCDRVDQAFLDALTCDSGAHTLRVLREMSVARAPWDPTALQPLCEDPEELTQPVAARAKVLCELLGALGIANVLDPSENSCTLTPEVLAALGKCEAFRDDSIAHVEQVFGLSSNGADLGTPGAVARRLKALFARAGLECTIDSQRVRRRPRVYKLDFATHATAVMAELLKSKYTDTPWRDDRLAGFMHQLVLTHILTYIGVVPAAEAAKPRKPPRKPRKPAVRSHDIKDYCSAGAGPS